MSTEGLLKQIEVVLPKYLTPGQQRELWAGLRSFPDVSDFYLPEGAVEAELLQGDGWRGFVAVNVETVERRTVVGLLVSNSCDVDVTNERALLPKVLFAPLVPVSGYRERLLRVGQTEQQVGSRLETIRRQEISNIFYLPPGPYGPDESLVLLDDLHQQPLAAFRETDRTLLFRLNQVAHYIFLIKLSIHFTRFNETVGRFPLGGAA